MFRLLTPSRRQPGFTLLELLVVMALIGLLSGIVAPRLWQWVEGAQHRADLDALQSAVQNLPSQTFFAGHRRTITSAADAGLPLPSDWRLELSNPLDYEANGMTNGGRITVWSGQRRLAIWQVVAPGGRLVPVDAAAQP